MSAAARAAAAGDAGARVHLWGAATIVAPAVVPFAPERRFRLLALLALRHGEWIARDQLAAQFWPDHGHAEARRNLRKVLLQARQLPGTEALQATEHALRWPVASDLRDFGDAVRQGRFADAIACRRGPLLDGLDADGPHGWAQWLAAERTHWDEAWRAAALQHLKAQADPDARVAAAWALRAVDPLDEDAIDALVAVELQRGRPAVARRLYDEYAAGLAEQLGIEPAHGLRERLAAAGTALAQPLRDRPRPAAPAGNGSASAAAGAGSASASASADSFVGRRLERAELRRLLGSEGCRWLSLTGPGGVGKSRLAREALADLAPAFSAEPLWFDLLALADADALPGAFARRLGLVGGDLEEPAAATARLASALAGGPRLVVLDNAEHLPGLAARLDALLDAAPGLSLLLTSRARLHGRHERTLAVAGLARPDEDSRDPEAALSFDAVRLFAERARLAQPAFDTVAQLPAVLDIVDALGGMPLAIELAASWVRLLPPSEIARELGRSADLLERDPGTQLPLARPEHASLRAVLDGSWHLLAPAERDALAALSVFRGGFTRSAALAVAAASLPLLSALVDKSLLEVDDAGRFGLHPVVGAYAAGRLAADPVRRAQVGERHAEQLARQLAAAGVHLHGDPRALADAVGSELANALAAWQYALAQPRADLVLAMVRPLAAFFELSGRIVEGVAALRPALQLRAADGTANRALARVRHALGSLHQRRGDARTGLELALAAAEQADTEHDTEAAAAARLTASLCHIWLGQAAQARALAAAALRAAEAGGDRHLVAWALGNLGLAHDALGEHEAALGCASRALALGRELDDAARVVAQLVNLGQHRMHLGQWPRAREHFEEALERGGEHGLHWATRYVQCSLGQVLLELGQTEPARRALQDALDRAHRAGEQQVAWTAELTLARIDLADGRQTSAVARTARVADAARRAGADYDVALAIDAWGALTLRRGDAAQAARMWRLALDLGVLEAAPARAIRARLDALPAAAHEAAAALSLPEALALIGAGLTGKR